MASGGGVMPALPPGFRFHPTDEELIVHYLTRQAASMASPVPIIAEVNIYKCNPWDLPDKALFGENEWYFFSPRDRKYPNGSRPNRAAGSGYWKATGTDKAILATPTSEHIGVKKALVFYRGKPPKGAKTDWIMHEYRLTATATTGAAKRRGSSMRLDDWVLCRIHKKCSGSLQQFSSGDLQQEQDQEGSTVEDSHNTTAINTAASSPPPKSEAFDDDDDEQQQLQQLRPMAIAKSCSITDLLNTVDYAALSQLRPMAIAKSCSITDLLNTVDYAALSQLLLDGGGSSYDQPPPPESPLIIYDAPPPAGPWQTLNNNYTDQIPRLADQPAARIDEHDYYANDNNNYSGYNGNGGIIKRKRHLEDGGAGDLGKRLLPQLLLPSDHHQSRKNSSSSSYCNQQLAAADQTSSSLHQYSSMLIHHPFSSQQQQLLNTSHPYHMQL